MSRFVSISDKIKLVNLIKDLHEKKRLFCVIEKNYNKPLILKKVEKYKIGLYPACWDVKVDGKIYYCRSFLEIIKEKDSSNIISEVRFSVKPIISQNSFINNSHILENSHNLSDKYDFIKEVTKFIRNNNFAVKSNNNTSITDYIKYVYGILNER